MVKLNTPPDGTPLIRGTRSHGTEPVKEIVEMAEEKPEGTPNEPENTPQPDSQLEGTPPETKPDDVNWEQRYKDLQAESTRASQEAADLRTRVEQLEQPPEEPPDEDLDDEEEGFLDRKTAKKMVDAAVQKAVSQVRTQSANAYFRRTYKNLVKYENAIAGLLRNPKDASKLKGASPEERIDAAVEEFNTLTEEAKATAKTEAEAEAKAKEEAKRKASGLGSTAIFTPAGDEGEKSDKQELADRKARSAKRRGLA